jgi:hypothetical protein
VNAICAAVSDADGEALFAPGDAASTGSLSGSTDGEAAGGDSVVVKTRRLDSILEDLKVQRLRMIKIDVEGSEGKVLSGAEATIRRHRPQVVVDLHTPEQDVFVAKFMVRLRYRMARLSGPPILRTDVGWPHQNGVWGSILATPER